MTEVESKQLKADIENVKHYLKEIEYHIGTMEMQTKRAESELRGEDTLESILKNAKKTISADTLWVCLRYFLSVSDRDELTEIAREFNINPIPKYELLDRITKKCSISEFVFVMRKHMNREVECTCEILSDKDMKLLKEKNKNNIDKDTVIKRESVKKSATVSTGDLIYSEELKAYGIAIGVSDGMIQCIKCDKSGKVFRGASMFVVPLVSILK